MTCLGNRIRMTPAARPVRSPIAAGLPSGATRPAHAADRLRIRSPVAVTAPQPFPVALPPVQRMFFHALRPCSSDPAARPVAGLWGRPRRDALHVARADHQGQRLAPQGRVDLSHRRAGPGRPRFRQGHLRGDAALRGRDALPEHRVRARHRARPGDREGALALRRWREPDASLLRAHVTRSLGVERFAGGERRVRAPHLCGHCRRAAARARRSYRLSLHGLR